MMVRESGAAAIANSMPDRPVYGWLLGLICGWAGSSVLWYVSISSILWAIFALQAGWLWQRLFPETADFACLAGATVLSPIAIQAQFCTMLISPPCVAPVILVLCGLLAVLGKPHSTMRLILAVICFGAGVSISEYAIAAVGPALLLLLAEARQSQDRQSRYRQIERVAVLAIVTMVTYAAFLHWANLGTSRPSVSPLEVQHVARKGILSIGVNIVNGYWHVLAGAYANAMSNVGIYWSSKSSLLGVGFGLALGGVFGWTLRRAKMSLEPTWILALAAGVLAGLLPVALMGRDAALPGFGSRFLTPVAPYAAALTLWWCLRLWNPAYLWIFVAGWGLICGNSVITSAQAAARDRDFLSSLSRQFEPYHAGTGNTVAVISRAGMDYELTARVTANWPVERAKRFWMYDQAAGEAAYGPRRACVHSDLLQKEVRALKRSGPVDHLLFVEVRGEKLVSIEPYCIAASTP